ncbi:predicted protein [Histoplasma mississippiense (nom. inval.)]|uniref:predicted protein n=1 Tax=Ajellomyces capsulatus (strain NAm1 / WU24) TaxID=2059318 RepID=UPI000157CE17|nr:predicted protein [Histoplasma mississippiense (nom. inval.)]EDN09990.1 predicted protein [Histoplasma mississippiense (nom. inval.)]
MASTSGSQLVNHTLPTSASSATSTITKPVKGTTKPCFSCGCGDEDCDCFVCIVM